MKTKDKIMYVLLVICILSWLLGVALFYLCYCSGIYFIFASNACIIIVVINDAIDSLVKRFIK